jgi:hypothetical protein
MCSSEMIRHFFFQWGLQVRRVASGARSPISLWFSLVWRYEFVSSESIGQCPAGDGTSTEVAVRGIWRAEQSRAGDCCLA